jgi:hypothetical protein
MRGLGGSCTAWRAEYLSSTAHRSAPRQASAPGRKTPAATIYSAILREMQKKGDDARFRKAARGKFELAS